MTQSPPTSLDSEEARKARGAFFTPTRVAEFIASWAVIDLADRVLEPSCGEAVFLAAAAHRIAELGGDPSQQTQLFGAELHPESARRAAIHVREAGGAAEITTGDFFLYEAPHKFDAVIGNPPYVRYQDFTGEARARSKAAALEAGVNLSALSSSWAAFTIQSALLLKPGGRMGLVLPAELLSVNYAAGVRKFLMSRFASLHLVMFEERVFPGVLEEVVLLLADGYMTGQTDHASIYQVRSPADLSSSLSGHRWTPARPEDKWTASLLDGHSLAAYLAISQSKEFTTLDHWGDTTLGMVTGNNRYFALSPARVLELGLEETDLLPLSPPGSKHLRLLEFSRRTRTNLGRTGSATFLFRPAGSPSAAAQRYIDAGHMAGVDTAYKCRVRSPWWRVPLLPPADLLITYMNSDTPRITTNSAHAHHLNSVHGVYLKGETRQLGLSLLPIASLNSLTLLGAEVVGRAYGGGMLKLEPREADALPVPSFELVNRAKIDLLSIKAAVTRALTSGTILDAAKLVDEVLIRHGMPVTAEQLATLRSSREMLAGRRTSRGPDARKV